MKNGEIKYDGFIAGIMNRLAGNLWLEDPQEEYRTFVDWSERTFDQNMIDAAREVRAIIERVEAQRAYRKAA